MWNALLQERFSPVLLGLKALRTTGTPAAPRRLSRATGAAWPEFSHPLMIHTSSLSPLLEAVLYLPPCSMQLVQVLGEHEEQGLQVVVTSWVRSDLWLGRWKARWGVLFIPAGFIFMLLLAWAVWAAQHGIQPSRG